MTKTVEAEWRSRMRITLCGVLALFIALFCLIGVSQNAYADTAVDDLQTQDIVSKATSAEGSGATGNTGVNNSGATGSGTTATTGGNETAGSPSAGSGNEGGTAGIDPGATTQPSNPSMNDQTTAPDVKKPVSKPTKAGWMKDADGTWYYFTSVNTAPKTGWVKSGGKWYWLQPDQNGAMATSTWITDKGKRYYVDANGVMKTGWIKSGNDWYYANGSGAQVMSGWQKVGGKWYWFLGNKIDGKPGLMAANQWIEDKGKRYYLTGSGAMATGWIKSGNDWYYANSSGAQVMSGWQKVSGKWYWFLGNKVDGKPGLMAANQWIEDKGKRYYLTGSGAMATGWIKSGNDWYYANGSGALVENNWAKVNNKWYWLQAGDESKNITRGLMFANGLKDIRGAKYSFDSNGAMRANCQVNMGNNIAGYAASSGAISRIGEYKDGKLVLTNSSGAILSGWQKVAGKWFYGEPGTGIAQTGWLKLGSTWYYLDGSGAMVTGTRTIDGKSHIFNSSGKWLGTDAMVSKAQGYSSGTSWLILVDRGAHKVGVFHGSKGNWNRERQFSCVTGAPGSPTITGVFKTTGGKRMNLSTDSRARWCTQISGGYFFHTILASNSELGHSLSHGCLRLAVPDAQWIYNNIGRGTTVVIYN